MINVTRFHFSLLKCHSYQVMYLLKYASLGVEILRIGRITTDSNNFKSSYKTYISSMIKQGVKLKFIE